MYFRLKPEKRLALVATLAGLTLGGCTTHKRTDWMLGPGPVRAQAQAPVTTVAAVPAPVINSGLAEDFISFAADRVYFDTDRATLGPNARQTLNNQAEWLGRHPAVQVRIEGNADERGSAAHNLALGQRRADAVRTFLIGRGVSGSRITTLSHGFNQPIAPRSSAAGLAKNRNAVTIVVAGL